MTLTMPTTMPAFVAEWFCQLQARPLAEAVDTYDVSDEGSTDGGILPHPGEFFHQVFLYHLALNGVEVVHDLV